MKRASSKLYDFVVLLKDNKLKGEIEHFPLVSCTIVTLTDRFKHFDTLLEITEKLAQMKK